MIAPYAAHMAQLKFYPTCQQEGWRHDLEKVEGLIREMHSTDEEARIMQEDLRRRAIDLVDSYWPIIEELAKALLDKPYSPMSQADAKWGRGALK